MVTQIDVEIPGDGVTLEAALFTPDNLDGPAPAITMANGFGGLRYSLYPFAHRFAEAGFVTLLHDHRNFGHSTGTPRHDIDPWQQIADWRRAISFLESRSEVDPTRIGLWGTSYAGGHALVLGATDLRLRAVVSQVPIISGSQHYRREVPARDYLAQEEEYNEDERAQLRGEAPRMITLVDTDPNAHALYHEPDIAAAYLESDRQGVQWSNELTVRSMRRTRMYEPGAFVSQISPTPLLMIVGAHDTMAYGDLGLAAYERALEPKRLEIVDGTHFAPYRDKFEQASTAAIDWFGRHLA